MRHFHLRKGTHVKGQPGMRLIIEHVHGGVTGPHEHDGMTRFSTTRKGIEREQQTYCELLQKYWHRKTQRPNGHESE